MKNIVRVLTLTLCLFIIYAIGLPTPLEEVAQREALKHHPKNWTQFLNGAALWRCSEFFYAKVADEFVSDLFLFSRRKNDDGHTA